MNKPISVNQYLGTFVSPRQDGNARRATRPTAVATRATGCRASSPPSSLTAARFLSRLAISILSGRQAGYFNALNCDSSHRSRHAWARALRSADRGIVSCFLPRYHEERERKRERDRLNSGALYRSEKWAGFRRSIGLFISVALRL